MPTRRRCCSVPGCPAIVVAGKCAKHRQREQKRYAAHRPDDSFYKSAKWQKDRAAQLKKQPLCQRCLAIGDRVRAIGVNHIVPRRSGGPDLPENYESCCRRHLNAADPRGAVKSAAGKRSRAAFWSGAGSAKTGGLG
jgi:5-methylcytosine-specific restriction enzyme A